MRLYCFLIVMVLVSGCMEGMHSMHENDAERFRHKAFESEGERLYFTGVSSAGERMMPVGGHHHMQMHGGSCVTCHGANKEGGIRMWPRFWVVAPALTKHALSKAHNDGHAHQSYDKTTLRNAIVNGVNPDGEALDETMPTWKISDNNLNELVHYLLAGEHKH